jgi:hypothetical protein
LTREPSSRSPVQINLAVYCFSGEGLYIRVITLCRAINRKGKEQKSEYAYVFLHFYIVTFVPLYNDE